MMEPAQDYGYEPASKPRGELPAHTILKLLNEVGTSALIAANQMLSGTRKLEQWYDLEHGVDELLVEARNLNTKELLARDGALIGSVAATLPAHCRAAYVITTNDLLRYRETWSEIASPQAVGCAIYRALLWHSVWHLIAAGIGMPTTIRTLGVPYKTVGWRLSRVVMFPAKALQTLPSRLARLRAAYTSWQNRPQRAPVAPPPKVERSGIAEPTFTTEPKPQAAPQEQPLARAPSKDTSRLNGRALRGSVFGTWLMLVFFTWTSIAYTGFFSMLMGVGFVTGILGFFGLFLVPAWGTFWGFAGMGAAQSQTLRKIGFEDVADDHHLALTVNRLAEGLGIPSPRIGTMPIANAFAVGKRYDDAAIAIGQPLIKILKPDELEAVIGHELGHIVSGDMRRMMLMRTFQNATVWFAMAQGVKYYARWWLCFFGECYIHSFSRKREYCADAIGAALTSKEAMIGALRAIDGCATNSSFEHTYARFMFHTRFRSHPPTEDRIAALEQETYIARLPRL